MGKEIEDTEKQFKHYRDEALRERIVTGKNRTVHKLLLILEQMDLFPEDYSELREHIRNAFLSFTNGVLDALDLQGVKPYRLDK